MGRYSKKRRWTERPEKGRSWRNRRIEREGKKRVGEKERVTQLSSISRLSSERLPPRVRTQLKASIIEKFVASSPSPY